MYQNWLFIEYTLFKYLFLYFIFVEKKWRVWNLDWLSNYNTSLYRLKMCGSFQSYWKILNPFLLTNFDSSKGYPPKLIITPVDPITPIFNLNFVTPPPLLKKKVKRKYMLDCIFLISFLLLISAWLCRFTDNKNLVRNFTLFHIC